MADNYEKSTVTPTLSAALFSELELDTLMAYGVHHEPSNDNKLYFFSEESSIGGDIKISQKIYAHIQQTADDNFVAAQYLDYIKANELHDECESDGITINLEEDINIDSDSETALTIESIFCSILAKEECKEDEIIIEGAYTCSKLRQGEFGGFVTRITKDSIQHGGTYTMLQEMRNPKKIQVVLGLQGGIVQSVTTEEPENLSVITIDYDTDNCDIDELTQITHLDGLKSTGLCITEVITTPIIDIKDLFDNVEKAEKLKNKD